MPFSSYFYGLPIMVKVLPHPTLKYLCTCLPVGEDRAIVALDHGFYKVEDTLFVDGCLRAVLWEHSIVGEIFDVIFLIGFSKDNLVGLLVDLRDLL